MKRKYKKALQDCFEPPAPQRKAQFLQQIQAEQSQDTATPLFFQRYPKWIRQSAMVFCAAAVLGIGYGAYQAFFDSRDQLEVVPPPETTTTAWTEPATTTTAETTRTTVTTGEKNSAETVLATAENTSSSSTSTVSKHTTSHQVPEKSTSDSKQTTMAVSTVRRFDTTTAKAVVTSVAYSTTRKRTTTGTKHMTTPLASTAVASEHTTAAQTTRYMDGKNDIQTVTTRADSCEPMQTKDYTVQPPCSYTVAKHVWEVASVGITFDTLSDLIAKSDTIVLGTTNAVTYTSIQGQPWIQVDVKLEMVFDSAKELHYGDCISIYIKGGYMPMTEYLSYIGETPEQWNMTAEQAAETSLFENNGDISLPKVGETLLE